MSELCYDPILGDTYGYPKMDSFNGWFRYTVGWSLLDLWEDEPATYFDYYIKEDKVYLHINMMYYNYYLEGDKITVTFPYHPYEVVFQ